MSKSGTRAPNGMGSIRKRKDGTYEGRYTGSDGKQHSVYAKTPKACGEALRAATHSVDTGSWLEPSTLSVAQWLNIWLADYQGHTTARTVHVYRGLVDRYITPVIGVVRLTALSPIHVRKVVSEMQKKGRAVSTIRCAHGVISAACNSAIEAKLLKVNPAEGMKLPQRVKTKLHIIDREQIPAFVAAAHEDVNGNALIFLLYTGLRAAELRGLQWADVDLDTASMNIHQQITVRPPSHRRRTAAPARSSSRPRPSPCSSSSAKTKPPPASPPARSGKRATSWTTWSSAAPAATSSPNPSSPRPPTPPARRSASRNSIPTTCATPMPSPPSAPAQTSRPCKITSATKTPP